MLNLQYISNEKFRFKTFIANRISEIHNCTEKSQWRHLGGDINPADLLTRGVAKPCQLIGTNKKEMSWLTGPAFLSGSAGLPERDTSIGEIDKSVMEISQRKILLTFNSTQECYNGLVKYDSFLVGLSY